MLARIPSRPCSIVIPRASCAIAVFEGDLRALCRESIGDHPADTGLVARGTRAGDDGDLAGNAAVPLCWLAHGLCLRPHVDH